MIVADSNTLAHIWFQSEHTHAVSELLEVDNHWTAPFLWRCEFRNILAGYIRLRNFTIVEAMEVWNRAEKILRGKEYHMNSFAVLGLVVESNCTAYDCEFVALAYQLNTKLITYDKQILREFPDIALTAEQYLSAISE